MNITSSSEGWRFSGNEFEGRTASYRAFHDPASNDPAAEDLAIDTPTDVTLATALSSAHCPFSTFRYEIDLFSRLAKLSGIEGRVQSCCERQLS